MRKTILASALVATALPVLPVVADPPPWAPAHGRRAHDRDEMMPRYYDGGQVYRERRLYRGDSVWRGRDGRYYCRRSDGTTGLIVGAAIGGLVGNRLVDGRHRTLGTVIGMVGGGLLGREIDRGGVRCR